MLEEKPIITENVKSKDKLKTNVDAVVLAMGSRSDKTMEEALKSSGYSYVTIGDCKKAGKIADATKAAYVEAIKI